jgi:hypothetical protein
MIKLSKIKKARYEMETEEEQKHFKSDFLDIFILCFFAMIGVVCVMLLAVRLAFYEDMTGLAGVLFILLAVAGAVLMSRR